MPAGVDRLERARAAALEAFVGGAAQLVIGTGDGEAHQRRGRAAAGYGGLHDQGAIPMEGRSNADHSHAIPDAIASRIIPRDQPAPAGTPDPRRRRCRTCCWRDRNADPAADAEHRGDRDADRPIMKSTLMAPSTPTVALRVALPGPSDPTATRRA
jgi:hypothetical protein